jgi:hypothetical protein
VPRSNIVEGRASNRLSWYGQRGNAVESLTGFLSFNRIWAHTDFGSARPIEGTDSLNLSSQLRGGWSASVSVSRPFVEFEPDRYASYSVWQPGGAVPFVVPEGVANWTGSYSLTTPVFQQFNGNVSVSYGGTAIFAEAADGRQGRISVGFGLRPLPAIRIDGSLVTTRITRAGDGSEYARSTIPRVKFEYQPRRSLFFRFVTEYRFEQRSALVDPTTGGAILINGSPVAPQTTDGWRADVLVSFEPTPGTVAFFGYGASLAKDAYLYQTPDYTRTTDGFFIKLAYQFRR